MKVTEKFLHLVWHYLLFEFSDLKTIQNEPIKIIKRGNYNLGQGPDFHQAVIEINGILWTGNIEIEIQSQNWYEHQHHINSEFNNVILLVCYEVNEKQIIFNSEGWEIPILVIKPYILQEVIQKLEILMQLEVPCKSFVCQYPIALQKNLLTQKALERLENKFSLFKGLDLEMISWKMLWKAFGAPYHSDLFLEISDQLHPNYFFECSEKIEKEALIYGIANFLNENYKEDGYFQRLKEIWAFLKIKYQLNEINPQLINYKTRFHSYPHVLIAQLIGWLHEHGNILLHPNLNHFRNWGTISDYWQNHIFFGKKANVKIKVGKQKCLKLLLNWYFPYHWYYTQHYQTTQIENLVEEFHQTEKEENHLIKKMEKWGWKIENGLESQGAIELYKNFCTKKRCLECNLGQWILKSKEKSNFIDSFCD